MMNKKDIDGLIGNDEDVKWFFNYLSEKPPNKILEVGAWDESISFILTTMGFDVIAVDLHEYDSPIPLNHKHIIGDFCTMNFDNSFDIAVSTSAIEHFGLGTYSDTVRDDKYDAVALHKIWNALKQNGVLYITIPYGKSFHTNSPHWRVYNRKELSLRILAGFTIESEHFFMSGDASNSKGEGLPHGKYVTKEEADNYDGSEVPHLTIGLKLRKNENHKWSK